MRSRIGLLIGLMLAVSSCQGAPLGVAQAPLAGAPIAGAQLTIDVAGFERAIAESKVIDWSSRTFASARILEAQQRRAERAPGYSVAAAAWPATPNWTATMGGTVSNAVGYAFADPVWATGPNPMNGDRLMVMSEAPRGLNNFFVRDPATGASLNGAGWDALLTVGAPGGSRVQDSAVTLSTKGTQAMFVTTGGYFGAIDTATGARTAGFSLGAGRLTERSAPFINNSAFPGIDERLEVWCATTNLANTAGQLHRLSYDKAAGTPWTNAAAITVRGPAADGSAGTVSAAGFKTSPVAWRGKVYIGDVAGRLWEYDIASGTAATNARYWDLSAFVGVGSDLILAPVAIDIATGDAVTHVFVSCGERVFWIDPASGDMAPSQSLLVDTATNVPGPKLQGSLSGYTFTGTDLAPIQANDSISCGPFGSGFDNDNEGNFGNEIVGSDHINAGDNRKMTGYLRFAVPLNYFTGRLPVSATLTMTIDPYTVPNASDAGSIFRVSTFLSSNTLTQDTTTQWTSNNMNSNNQPRFLVPDAFSQRNGPASPNGTPYDWNVAGAVPRDNASYAFAMRGAGKAYNGAQGTAGAAPGYYGAFYGNNAAQRARRPKLTIKVANNGLKGALLSQPMILAAGANPKVYVASSNALFEMDYTNPGLFGSAAETYFSLTQSGRGVGTDEGVIDISAKFIQNQVSTAIGSNGSSYFAYVCDDNDTRVPRINKFNLPLNRTPNADSLAQTFNLPSGSRRTTRYMTWDYFSGSLYFATQGPASAVYRLQQ